MTERRCVLVVAAHPDDEVLGCGGTIARLAADGVDVHVAFLADGVGVRGAVQEDQRDALEARRAAAAAAARILGACSLSFDDLPDNQLDIVPLLDITQRVEALIARLVPDTVFTHHAGDLNIDHRRVHQAVLTACRPQQSLPVRTVLAFEVPSSTEWQPPGSGEPFVPTSFVDIGLTLAKKLAALDAYATEMRPWPHPRSHAGVEALARWRGASVGCEAAEAFVIVRHVCRSGDSLTG
jgi:LmbE family N-acetylglucosaminyl deacetylase